MFRTPPVSTTSHINDITHTRLINYKNIFAVKDDSELHGIYSWNEEIAAKMVYLIGMIEVTLRNRIYGGISKLIFNKSGLYCQVPHLEMLHHVTGTIISILKTKSLNEHLIKS